MPKHYGSYLYGGCFPSFVKPLYDKWLRKSSGVVQFPYWFKGWI